MRTTTSPLTSLFLLSLAACTTEHVVAAPPAGGEPTEAAEVAEEPSTDADPDQEVESAVRPADTCSVKPPKKSKCNNEASWVRGVVHWDPADVKASKPILRVLLRHSFILVDGEETIGGRLHGFTSIPIADPAKGEADFAIDMCAGGAEMWSEENGAFNVIFIMDENGDNDMSDATTMAESLVIGTPSPTELAKRKTVDVSCHATAAPCLDVNLDCIGPTCTTITPIEECTVKSNGCPGGQGFCH